MIFFLFRMLDKDPFEMEDEEYENELEEESIRSSESDGIYLNFLLCFLIIHIFVME